MNPDRLIHEVGRRLAELREMRGLTQQELADQLGKTMRYIQAVEAGTENLTLRSIATFANALRARVAELFEQSTAARRRPGRPRKRVAS